MRVFHIKLMQELRCAAANWIVTFQQRVLENKEKILACLKLVRTELHFKNTFDQVKFQFL